MGNWNCLLENFQQESFHQFCFRNYKNVYISHLYFINQTEAYKFIKKETLAQVFSCEFCGVFKNSFFTEQLQATASAFSINPHFILKWKIWLAFYISWTWNFTYTMSIKNIRYLFQKHITWDFWIFLVNVKFKKS